MQPSDSHSPPGARRSNIRALIAINAALLLLLAAVTFGPAASGQARQRGEYTMVGGGVSGSESSAVYIVDTRNQELIAIAFDINSRTLQGVAYRNLANDAAQIRRRAGQ
ncbi:MAG: hypothetical protein ACYTGC_13800 [Planctomycetota bacterium]|jgi:hypothetical protein